MKITFLTESLDANSLGRTYSLWLICRHLGWQAAVLTTRGRRVWQPLEATPFASECRVVGLQELERMVGVHTDLLVACKPLPESLGLALDIARRRGTPLLVDVDDPDLEARLHLGTPGRMIARALVHPRRTIGDINLRRAARALPSLVSNPWLQGFYGGTLLPHARSDLGEGDAHTSRQPRVAFVGTNRRHKGLGLVRAAVSALSEAGFSLVVTDDPPEDAQPWESWVGQTSIEAGMDIVRHSDIVALPSLPTDSGRGQLPAKLIDAMLLSRALVVSDVEPMPWAVSGCGLVVKAGSQADLARALQQLEDPQTRAGLGASARARALQEFTVEALAGRFEAACAAVVNQHETGMCNGVA